MSPFSTCSQVTSLNTPQWDGKYNPFDISFGKFPSYSQEEEDVSATTLFSPTATSDGQPWSTSPSLPTNLPQTRFVTESCPPDTGFIKYEQEPSRAIELPILDCPVTIIPSRKRKASSELLARARKGSIQGIRCNEDATSPLTLESGITSPDLHTKQSPAQLAKDCLVDEACTKQTPSKVIDDKERHKHVEMKYRMQMKDRFADLLRALPDESRALGGMIIGKNPELDKKMTRGKVLDLAKEHIDALDRTRRALEREREMLRYQISMYEAAWLSSGYGALPE